MRLDGDFVCCGVNTGIISTEVAPFGGMKESGLGREGVREAVRSFTRPRLLVVRRTAPREGERG